MRRALLLSLVLVGCSSTPVVVRPVAPAKVVTTPPAPPVPAYSPPVAPVQPRRDWSRQADPQQPAQQDPAPRETAADITEGQWLVQTQTIRSVYMFRPSGAVVDKYQTPVGQGTMTGTYKLKGNRLDADLFATDDDRELFGIDTMKILYLKGTMDPDGKTIKLDDGGFMTRL